MADNTMKKGLALTYEKINTWVADFYSILPNIMVGIIIFLLFFSLSLGIKKLVTSYFNHTNRIDLGRITADFSFWLVNIIGFLVFLTIVVPSLKPVDLLASFGFGSIAFGFAFKDILQNSLAGLLILLRLPFRRGDQIRVNEAEGTVQRIEPRATIIRTYDGRDIVVPNTTIYTNIVIIHTSLETRRVEMDFTVGYTYGIARITQIIREAIMPIKEVLDEPPPQVLCWELGSTSLGIKLRWWINSERAQEVISRARIVQAIKEAFEANNIDPTDPQLIYYRESEEPQQPKETKPISLPPEVPVSRNDPEADKPKIDSKKGTLLPDA